MTETMTTSQVLNRAADLIEERGWTRGAVGWLWVDDSSSHPVCLEGALYAALGLRFDEDEINSCPAYRAVATYLGDAALSSPETTGHGLWVWNDADERTATEVIATLRAVAVIEAAREDVALLAEVGR